MRVVVVGAGVGGLTAASVLAKAGCDVAVLESNPYAGGCAGTFYYQGYRFDVGATLAAGFYDGGPMDLVAMHAGIGQWPVRPCDVAMGVHLPDGSYVRRVAGETRWAERRALSGPSGEPFWRWQERTADALWTLAQHLPPWPPASMRDAAGVTTAGLRWLRSEAALRDLPGLAADATRVVARHLPEAEERLRLFADAQLLISAQATADRANALYGAAALDLPRRGAVHVEGGMGGLADALVSAVAAHGGRVHLKTTAERIASRAGGYAVETSREQFAADMVIANVLPANLARLLGEEAPQELAGAPAHPSDAWGAFTTYVGVDDSALEPGRPLHHQVVVREPLGEGNSVFLSLSPEWDGDRAPPGKRAITVSTHSALRPWWALLEKGRPAYEDRKAAWAERVLAAADVAVPGLSGAAELVLPGTPVTFHRFTAREHGWVGGYPQTSLLRAKAPRVLPGFWMVGDSVFPGQSTTAVALGGLRVALDALGRRAALPGSDAK